MKKIILSVAAVFAFGFANAQETTEGGKGFTKGDIFISGTAGFTSQKQGDFKASEFNITPMVGFMVTENIAIGGMIGYANETADIFDEDLLAVVEEKTNTFSVGAFGRYYWTPANNFSFFGQAGISYASSTSEVDIPGTEEFKVNAFGIEIAPGVSYFIGDNWAIEATLGSLGYSSAKADVDGAEALNTFGLNLNLSDIQFGIVYKF